MMITQLPKKIWMLLLSIMGTLLFIVSINDAMEFHDVVKSSYKTPWYSTNWVKQPYTNLRLAFHPKREYWTENAIHSERWLVREVEFYDTTFWTIRQSNPKAGAQGHSEL